MQKLHDVCTVDGCIRQHKARGYCQTHYAQFKRLGRIETVVINSRVSVKPSHCTVTGCADVVKGKGLCQKHYARRLRHGHTRYLERTKPAKLCAIPACGNWLYANELCHKHYLRTRLYAKMHGLSAAETVTILLTQPDVCQLCDQRQTTRNHLSAKLHDLYLDHDHKTGKLRGFLCNSCNRGLGFFKDNTELLEKASVYLRKHAI